MTNASRASEVAGIGATTSSPLVGEEGARAKRGKVRGNPSARIARARELRRNATPAEAKLWRGLRETFPTARFRRQVPLGRFFADFCSHGARLVIELDGGQHAIAVEADNTRTAFLNSEGYRVLRFWNNNVIESLDGVLKTIAANLPSPLVGEGAPQGRMRGACDQ